MKVLLIPVDAPPYELETEGTLADLQALVGGYIEAVMLMGGRAAFGYINEEGKIKGLPRNELATFLADTLAGDYIAGPMVVLGESDDEGNETDVPESTIGYIDRIAGVKRLVEA